MSTTGFDETSRTVRELGGAIWAELSTRIPNDELDWRMTERMMDIVLGVLARHLGKVIADDSDLPVRPL
jgi:hypothetical protein